VGLVVPHGPAADRDLDANWYCRWRRSAGELRRWRTRSRTVVPAELRGVVTALVGRRFLWLLAAPGG
jgi:hypothetical protein